MLVVLSHPVSFELVGSLFLTIEVRCHECLDDFLKPDGLYLSGHLLRNVLHLTRRVRHAHRNDLFFNFRVLNDVIFKK